MKEEANPKDIVPAKVKPRSSHVTTACKVCRTKKIKCDFNRPRCSNCVLYSQDCIFPTTIDKRKIPSKDRIAALTAHAQNLETLLRQNGIPFQPILDGSPLPILEESNFRRTSDGGQNPGLLRRETTNESRIENPPTIDPSEAWLPIENPADPLASSPSSFQQPYSTPPPLQEEALIDQLTGRMGSMQIAEDGQKRFYGATSNLHILHNGPMSLTRSRFSSLQREGEILLKNRGLDPFVDREFEDHLIKLYFCWEDPSIHVMDEELFFRERDRCKGTYETSYLYSEVLVNAM
jgi:Fungal Zn(2)-Cys(6) binuclear cluster domain